MLAGLSAGNAALTGPKPVGNAKKHPTLRALLLSPSTIGSLSAHEATLGVSGFACRWRVPLGYDKRCAERRCRSAAWPARWAWLVLPIRNDRLKAKRDWARVLNP